MAGISLRCARSPVAPKITSTHGSGTRCRSSPSRSGFMGGVSISVGGKSEAKINGVRAIFVATSTRIQSLIIHGEDQVKTFRIADCGLYRYQSAIRNPQLANSADHG